MMKKTAVFPVIVLALGHLVTDMQAGALPIVLPHLKELFALSYAQLAFIVLLQNVTSSVIQPVFGYLTDKRSLPGMLPFCAALAGAGFAAVGWAGSYAMVLFTVIVIGIASATYHPQASKTTNFLSDESNKARNMGIFSLGGNAGMAAGSLLMTLLLGLSGGLRNTLYFVLPGVLVFGFMLHCMPEYKRVNKEHEAARRSAAASFGSGGAALKCGAVGVLLLYIFLRSTVHTGLATYLPLYFLQHRQADAFFAGSLVTILLLGGVAGTYLGALCTDRFGARRVMLCSMLLSAPAIALILAASSQAAAAAAVAGAGFLIIASSATTVVVAQTMMPDNVGMASGLTIGFSVGLGGFGVTLLGILADHFGLQPLMELIIAMSAAAGLLVFKLPIPKSLG